MKTEIQIFLKQLIDAQHQMLAVLQTKQQILVHPEKEAMAAITAEEEKTLATMQRMLERREELLTAARLQNVPGETIEQLCEHFFPRHLEVQKLLNEIKNLARQISFLGFTNWKMGRQSLIHIEQILELLETRGQGITTYHPQSKAVSARGVSVDRIA